MRRIVLERRPHRYARRMKISATVVRISAHCLMLDVDGERGWVDRSSGEGMRMQGNPALQRVPVRDLTGWRLRWSDWSEWYVEQPGGRPLGWSQSRGGRG